MCFFEDDLGVMDWRHTHHGADPPRLDGIRSTDFVVRMVTTPGNYDYVQVRGGGVKPEWVQGRARGGSAELPAAELASC